MKESKPEKIVTKTYWTIITIIVFFLSGFFFLASLMGGNGRNLGVDLFSCYIISISCGFGFKWLIERISNTEMASNLANFVTIMSPFIGFLVLATIRK